MCKQICAGPEQRLAAATDYQSYIPLIAGTRRFKTDISLDFARASDGCGEARGRHFKCNNRSEAYGLLAGPRRTGSSFEPDRNVIALHQRG
jgi:hypothetical protein